MPARWRAGIGLFGASAVSDARLRLADQLVGEEDEPVTDGLGVDEAHGFLVAGLPEEAPAVPEHDREDDQPQLIDQVVLDQRAPELIAGVDDDLPVQLLLQPRDLVDHVASEPSRWSTSDLRGWRTRRTWA